MKTKFQFEAATASYDIRRQPKGGFLLLGLKGPFSTASVARREKSYLTKRGVLDESWEVVEWGKKNPGWVLRGPEYSRSLVRTEA